MPTARNGEIEIVYEKYGKGEPVLFIMGLGGTKELWEPQIEGLRDRFQVIVFDNRGVGESTIPKSAWTMADMAKDAVSVLDAEGLREAHVVGASMGGMIAQHVALDHPERVRRLALCCTTAGTFVAPPKPEIFSLLLDVKGKTREEVARNSLRLMFTPETVASEKALCEHLMALSIRYAPPARGFAYQIQAVTLHDTLRRLPELLSETLVVTGDRDELVPPRNSEIIAQAIPNARLVVVPGTSHGFFFDRAEEMNDLVAEFLNR